MQHDTPLLRSLQIQLRMVGALLIREILIRYGWHNTGFLWVSFEPMVLTLGVTVLWALSKATHGSSLPITTFAVTGYSLVPVWRNSAGRCTLVIEPNQSLLYHCNIRMTDLFLSRVILETAGATISSLFLTTLFVTLGTMESPTDITQIIGGWIYLSIFGIGLDFIVGTLSGRGEAAERIWHAVTYLLFPPLEALFMVDWMLRAVQKYILLLPMVHGVEMVRGGCLGALVKSHYDIGYTTVTDLVVLLVGLFLVMDASKRVEPE